MRGFDEKWLEDYQRRTGKKVTDNATGKRIHPPYTAFIIPFCQGRR